MRLFVYGTLRRDAAGRIHPMLAQAVFDGPATVTGRLYRVAWYPGVILDPAGDLVTGELYLLPAGAHILEALDAYEGATFARRRVIATREDARVTDAWIYEWLGTSAGLARIESGDWHAASGPDAPSG
jgi:gamma-glutamylcyclotransferase (GGCT)/AIG2-like uncharacterized protein YtfP